MRSLASTTDDFRRFRDGELEEVQEADAKRLLLVSTQDLAVQQVRDEFASSERKAKKDRDKELKEATADVEKTFAKVRKEVNAFAREYRALGVAALVVPKLSEFQPREAVGPGFSKDFDLAATNAKELRTASSSREKTVAGASNGEGIALFVLFSSIGVLEYLYFANGVIIATVALLLMLGVLVLVLRIRQDNIELVQNRAEAATAIDRNRLVNLNRAAWELISLAYMDYKIRSSLAETVFGESTKFLFNRRSENLIRLESEHRLQIVAADEERNVRMNSFQIAVKQAEELLGGVPDGV